MYQSCLGFVESFLSKDHKRSHSQHSASGKLIYHERQQKELCALHALNNLFQDGCAFNKQQLDEICYRYTSQRIRLSPDNILNPHKSMLGLGNYDVNVIMAALQLKGYEAVWFDKRKDPSCLELAHIVGFILNIPSDMKFGFLQFPLNRKHWIAVREIEGTYYNLDSKLDGPTPIGMEPEVLQYLREQLHSKEKELFVVMHQEVERTKSWRKDPTRRTSNQQQTVSQPSSSSENARS